MPLVFVSHSEHDRDIALKLVERLRKAAPADIDIVIADPIDARSDAIGIDAYRLPYVGKRLRSANAVVAVLTRSYAESDPCWLEMSAALMMEKIVPINLDPGLSPAGLNSMVPGKAITAVAPAWFSKEPGEVEAAETARFEVFVRELTAECARHSPFTDWTPAEPREVRPLTAALTAALRPKMFRRTGLVWSPGSIAEVQKRRFFAAIDHMSIATGDTAWDVARRKVLKAMAAEPNEPRVRAEALMGLIGELTAPLDGSPPVTAHEPWEFVGDFALPIDRDISRFAYMRAGKIPNELRKLFQVLRPGRSKRRSLFALGAVLGGVVGAILAYGGQLLFGQPALRLDAAAPTPGGAEPPQRAALPNAPTRTAPQTTAQATPQAVAPSAPQTAAPQTAAPQLGDAFPEAPPTTLETSSATSAGAFSVSARGLEATVKGELARRGLEETDWREVYGTVISLNLNTLCTPEKWLAADATGRKPLDLISKEAQLTWPTEIDLQVPSRLQECPVWRIPV